MLAHYVQTHFTFHTNQGNNMLAVPRFIYLYYAGHATLIHKTLFWEHVKTILIDVVTNPVQKI